MHSTIIATALTLAAVPALGQATATTAAATTAAPTTTPAPDTAPCSSLLYSLLVERPGEHPAMSSWFSEQQASRSSALAATPSLSTECMPLGFVVPSSLWPAESSGYAAQYSWESARATEISSVVARCSAFIGSEQASWQGVASSRSESRLSCESKTRTMGRSSMLATTTAAANSTSGTTRSSTTATTSGTGAAQSGTPGSGAGRVGGMGVVGVAAAVFAGLASWI